MKHYKRYLVTSALPYANGPLHIGHLAGAYLPADIYVRYLRLTGKDVVYICGSDENGAAITLRAKKEDTTPQAIIDKYHPQFKESFRKVGISFDYYHRTSAKLHHETSQDFFRTLYNKGVFEEKVSEQYYDEEAGQFLADRYITGTCPKCSYDEAYGDQCENCGSSLSPNDLIDPRSTITGKPPVMRETSHWYLPLNKDEDWLRDWIVEGKLDGKEHHDPSLWKNHVIGQCKSWLDGGLQPRAITRDLDWGVDVPKDIPGHEGKKLYVWMDAPIGYVSSTKQWAIDSDKNWEPYWQSDDTALIHFIGKDNIVFHCLIFPAILRAHGDFILPTNVPANQFMNLEGKKISTSRNWAVWVHEFVEELEGHEDALRYYMIKNMPEQRDSEFTWKGFQDSNNNELVNNLANFVNRVLVLTNKYYDGAVPGYDPELPISSSEDPDHLSFHENEMLILHDELQEMGGYIMRFDFRSALQSLMRVSSNGNQLLQFNEPWKLQKEDPETVKVVLNASIQIVTALSVAMKPFMPFASDRLRHMLNLPLVQAEPEMVEMLDALAEGEDILPKGHQINKAEHLFGRIEDDLIEAQIEKLKVSSEMDKPKVPLKKTIQYDDFVKLDIRTATIIEAEKVKKADKLLKLTLDLGFEKRTVVSGIAQHYNSDEILGNKVLILANLAPRKLMGIESQGMILMAEDEAGRLTFASVPEDWENGSAVS